MRYITTLKKITTKHNIKCIRTQTVLTFEKGDRLQIAEHDEIPKKTPFEFIICSVWLTGAQSASYLAAFPLTTAGTLFKYN